MNPWQIPSGELLAWGIALHLIADFPLQNEWMALHKGSLKHPAAYVHGFIHMFFLAVVFGWAAIPLALAHILIDTRWPVILWSQLIGQTQPTGRYTFVEPKDDARDRRRELMPVYDMGTEVRMWTDQVFHIACIMVAAVLVTL